MPAPTLQQALRAVDDLPWDSWRDEFRADFDPVYLKALADAGAVGATLAGGTWNPEDPFVKRFASRYAGTRIVQLERTTKAEIKQLLRSVFEQYGGAAPMELQDAIRDAIREKFHSYEEYRAARIARTESALVYNHGNLLAYGQSGVREVEVEDGVVDEICSDAVASSPWTVDQAMADPLGHPNCQRSFTPLDGQEARPALWSVFTQDIDADDLGDSCALAAAAIEERADPHGRMILLPEDDE